MRRSPARQALTVLIVTLLTAAGCSAPKLETTMRTADEGSAQPDSAAVAQDLGPTRADEQVQFTISLRLPGAAQLGEYIEGLSVPGSPSYRQYLRPEQFGELFGLPLVTVERVVAWLESAGLAATALPQRTSVSANGSAAQVSALLEIELVDRLTADGRRYHVTRGDPALPADLAADVAIILGLDSEPVIKPALGSILAAGVPAGGLQPETVARAYEITPLHEAGLHGEGLAVAIVSFDTYTAEDVGRFDERMGIAGAPAVEQIRLPGAKTEPGDSTGEVALDIQVIRGIAPAARIINYEGPNVANGFVPLISRIVADGQAQVISISWGLCELYSSRAAIEAEQRELAAAFAAGISVFVASGDNGAFDCRRVEISEDPFERDLSQAVEWPASSPSVVGVGGTFLSVSQDGSYVDEAGWEEPLGGSGGGGGLSQRHSRPDWQRGAGVDNAASNGMRQVPDVAGPADPSSGFFVIYTEPGEGVVSGQIGGTSAAAPFWAASMLLIQQLARREGVPALGPLGPVLYGVAAEQPVGAVFHDIVRGGNLLFSAAPGWDYSTGLGTPRVAPLARAIVDYLSR